MGCVSEYLKGLLFYQYTYAGSEGRFPDFINIIYTGCYIGIFPAFIIANIQTVVFTVVLSYLLPFYCLILLYIACK